MAAKKKNTGKLLNYLQVQTTYLTLGAEAVRKLLQAKKVTPDTVRKAAADLQKGLAKAGRKDGAKVVSLLNQVVNAAAPLVGKGKKPPQIGQERDYKTQVIEGKHTMRLPLDTLIDQKGKVRVKFEKDRITVVRVRANAAKVKKAA